MTDKKAGLGGPDAAAKPKDDAEVAAPVTKTPRPKLILPDNVQKTPAAPANDELDIPEGTICCGNCPHFAPNSGTKKFGQCREPTPTPLLVGTQMVNPTMGADGQLRGTQVPRVDGFFPPTSWNVLCGKHPARIIQLEQMMEQMRSTKPMARH